MIEVRTQAQLDRALKKTSNGADELIVCLGGGHFTLWENSTATLWGNSTATLWGNSTATLRGNSTATLWENSTATLWGNSTATLWENSTATLRGNSTATLWGNSTATLWENSTATLRGNSTATLWGNSTATLWGNSTATLWENSTATLRGNSTARAWERSRVDAAKTSVVLQHSSAAKIKGGRILEMPRPETGADWCEFYGVEITEYSEVARHGAGASDPDNTDHGKPPFYAADETGGKGGLPVAILFKAVGKNFVSSRGCSYTPGTAPSAPDWDGGKEECGGGLHFSPHPVMAEEFHEDPDHFVACPVLVSEIVVHPDGMYPQKVKAPRVAAPCWEVDRDGQKIEAEGN